MMFRRYRLSVFNPPTWVTLGVWQTKYTVVSKAQWLEAGQSVLGERGVAGITVEGLARDLGIAKAGFYWHFKNRDEGAVNFPPNRSDCTNGR